MTKQEEATGYKNLVDLMALHADASNRLDAMEAALQEKFIGLVDDIRTEFAKLSLVVSESQAAIEEIALLNPEWFFRAKTIKTPYGSVGFRKTTKLVVKNEEVSILLIEQRGPEASEKYIRSRKELNLEALEQLDDADLRKLRISRETSESCTVKAAKLDLGKAVKKPSDDKAA